MFLSQLGESGVVTSTGLSYFFSHCFTALSEGRRLHRGMTYRCQKGVCSSWTETEGPVHLGHM